ncbi:MAG TPA: hypothetical protein VK646_14150 [Actinomycetota bacterium]|nr:hypothetical protein [Actinomycetota bacterium]
MHGWRKVAVWVGVFVVAIVAGAVVAAHSNPFPPGVDEGSVATPSATPSAATDRWALRTTTDSAHVLHVGGTCRGRWVLDAPLSATPDGTVLGSGTAVLRGKASCPFGTAQVPARRIPVDISGHVDTSAMVLVFRADNGTLPAGSLDLAGYVITLPVIRLAVDGMVASGTLVTTVPDGDQGTYRSVLRATATCSNCALGVSPSGPTGSTTASP